MITTPVEFLAEEAEEPPDSSVLPQIYLAVDDELHLEQLQSLLSHGYQLHCFDSHSALVRGVVVGSPDLVVVDLAGTSSRELSVCSEVRRRSSVPLVVLSPRTAEIDVVLALEVGADAYIVKPYRGREFVARLRAVLRRPRVDIHQGGAVVAAGDIVMYLEARKVQVGSRVFTIPGREFELLKLLLDRPGRAVPRFELMQRLSPDLDGGRVSLDSAIRRLRAIIEDDPAKPRRVVSVRGYGYRLNFDLFAG